MYTTLVVTLSLGLTLSADAGTRDPSRYSRILLPFHDSVPSGEGVWRVRWWFRNDGTKAVDAFPLAFNCGLPPPPIMGVRPVFVPGNPSLPPRTTPSCLAGDALPSIPVPPFVPLRSTSVGAFIYAEELLDLSFAISGEIVWQPSARSLTPAPLRAVPEASFRSGPASIFPVPWIAGARYDVRVYALPETVRSPRVTIRVFEMQPFGLSASETLVLERVSAVSVPDTSLLPCINACDIPSVTFAPAVLQVLGLMDGEANGPRSPLRIEIEPESPEMKWSAAVSALVPETRELMIYQPPF